MDVDKWLGSITPYEAAQIWARFHDTSPNALVLWSGISIAQAARWARQHQRQTLTQAMGPLMDVSHPVCRRKLKSPPQWSRYVHAASILFALYISTGAEVVVLTPYAPERLNPYGESYYQNIEEPWLKACCDRGTFRILFAHPGVPEATDYTYQYWPEDRVAEWEAVYPGRTTEKKCWPHHGWDKVPMSRYQPDDLRRERCIVMEKLHQYRTGASVYWLVSLPANKPNAICSATKSDAVMPAATGCCCSAAAKPKARKLTKKKKKVKEERKGQEEQQIKEDPRKRRKRKRQRRAQRAREKAKEDEKREKERKQALEKKKAVENRKKREEEEKKKKKKQEEKEKKEKKKKAKAKTLAKSKKEEEEEKMKQVEKKKPQDQAQKKVKAKDTKNQAKRSNVKGTAKMKVTKPQAAKKKQTKSANVGKK